mmetsp:Transcript_13854/g.11835  ORF Transcript_13854/g.11835 Transcript_13854/m.11835 type:complete len:106 (+) Transcript_13854:1156-1473(+)
MANPISDLTFTPAFLVDVIYLNTVIYTITYNTLPVPTWTYGTFTTATITPAVSSVGETTLYTIQVQSDKVTPAGGAYELVMPADIDMSSTLICSADVAATCSING